MPGGARFVEGSTCETKFDVEARESNNTRQTWLFSRGCMQSGTLWVKQDRTPTGGIDVSDDLDFFWVVCVLEIGWSRGKKEFWVLVWWKRRLE